MELEKIVDTSDEWIRARTGIMERRMAAPDQAASDLGLLAAERALEAAGVSADAIDVILVATATPDMPFPPTACIIQEKLGASGAAFDLNAVCSGFLYALSIGAGFILSGMYDTILVIGTEVFSRILDWKDRNTCVLFGDGAGAAVLQATDYQRLFSSYLGSNGTFSELLMVPAGGSRMPTTTETVDERLHFMKMSAGREVFKRAVHFMSQACQQVLNQADLQPEHIDFVIPHQANIRILQALVQRLGLPESKLVENVHKYGNTSAASIPIALDEAVRSGKISQDDTVLLTAFGSGLTYGAILLKW